jgi:WD40-like Beta Propeller Repeat
MVIFSHYPLPPYRKSGHSRPACVNQSLLIRMLLTSFIFNSYSKVLLLVFCFYVTPVFSQSPRMYERAGDEAMAQKDYNAAFQHYGTVAAKSNDDLSLQWKYAESARLFSAYDVAERAYQSVAKNDPERRQFPLVDFRLGEIKKQQGNYIGALEHFGKFLADKPQAAPNYFTEASRKAEACHWAQVQMASGRRIEIKHLGKEINSAYSDFAPVALGDTLVFSSYRFDKRTSRRHEPAQKTTRLLMSVKGGRAKEPGHGMPAGDSAHVAHATFSPDGRIMVFTSCKNVNATDIRCELWMTRQDIRGRWTKPMRLPDNVNMPGYTTTQPMMGEMDPQTHQLGLWFASDRPGGKGKLDLWSVPLDTNYFCPCEAPVDYRKPRKMTPFKNPTPLTALNTPENDGTPFYHAPTKALYFGSEGWPGFGGYDIFVARRDSAAAYGQVENAGAGLNTSYNDLYFFLRPDGKSGYLSSNRTGAYYLDERHKACCNDIFAFRFPEPTPTEPIPPVTHQTMVFKDPNPPTVNAPNVPVLTTTPKPGPEPALADFVGLPLYFDNDQPDPRTRRTATRLDYAETIEVYLAKQETYRTQFATGLRDIAAENAEADIDRFFEQEVRGGYERLGQLTELLVKRLQEGQRIEIAIQGYTSPRARTEYNQLLGKRRISSVRNYFANYADGLLRPFMDKGQLKVMEQNFGEMTAQHINDDLNDLRSSVYSPAAARERRVEIVEIKQQ